MSLGSVASTCDGRLVADAALRVMGVCTDSRAVKPGSLFVAIKGERFDGHDHAHAAIAHGARACLLAREISGVPSVIVSDTIVAFQKLAANWRNTMRLPVLALTGSNGKTTVKEMLRAILIAHHGSDDKRVLATEGNLNNHLGVPLMLSRLSAEHRNAVFEAGMNHFGEIQTLTHLISPNVALINNAGPAHLEGVGDLDGVARAKGEIFDGLVENGTAVLNADDVYFHYWRGLTNISHSVVSFGKNEHATIRGSWADTTFGAPMQIHVTGQVHQLALPLTGEHNRMNALAATAGAFALGVEAKTAVEALANFAPVQGRQRVHTLVDGSTVIDDTYNANPASVKAAIDSLLTHKGHRVLVLGQLAELGTQSERWHAQIGEWVGRSAIDDFFATGERMRVAVDTCIASRPNARWFATKEELVRALHPQLGRNVFVLVKGSRSSAMEDVVNAIVPNTTTKGAH